MRLFTRDYTPDELSRILREYGKRMNLDGPATEEDMKELLSEVIARDMEQSELAPLIEAAVAQVKEAYRPVKGEALTLPEESMAAAQKA